MDESCTTVMQLQYADTGFLINKLFMSPDKITVFFDLTLLRNVEQTLFTGTLKAHLIKNVFVRTLLPIDWLRLKNNGAETYVVCLSNTADPMSATLITILPGGEKIVLVSEFGAPDLPQYRFLHAENKSDSDTAFEIEIE